jgi:peroxiredoxin
MVAVNSTMLPLGTVAPDFDLPDTQGKQVGLADFRGAQALLIAFICNHCPYVKHLQQAFVELASEYQQRGVAFVAISSNDAVSYPADGPERMAEEARRASYSFPYLYDESQDVAKTYRAACTPDFYLFDQNQRLVYRGQFDDSRPGNGVAPTGTNLRAALDALLAGRAVEANQRPSIGCNIKWKPGKEPEWFG